MENDYSQSSTPVGAPSAGEGVITDRAPAQATVPRVSILAGNSRLAVDAEGRIIVEAQLRAFNAAMACAARCRNELGEFPTLSVAFDHQGVFRKQFLAERLTNGQKRNPRLDQLHPTIQSVFAPIAERWAIPLGSILAIHEDSARSHLDHLLKTETIDPAVRHRIVAVSGNDEKPVEAGQSEAAHGTKLTCAAITREYFEKAGGGTAADDGLLEVFFEDTPWSRPLAYVRGLQMTHMLGSALPIRLNLVDADGNVRRGEIASSGDV